MSADLFAEFAAPSQQQQQQSSGTGQARAQPASAFSFFDDLSSTPAPVAQSQPPSFQFEQNTAPTFDDADDWGDFESVSAPQPSSVSTPAPAPAFIKQDPFAFTSTQPSQPSQSSWQKAPILKAKRSADPNVLFDAEDDPDDDDDDFGDFEGVDSSSTPATLQGGSTGLADLLGDMSVSQPKLPITSQRAVTNTSHILPVSSSSKRTSGSGFGTVVRAKQPSPIAPSFPVAKQEDAWDTFDDWEASIPTKPQAKTFAKPKGLSQSRISTPPPSIPSPAFDEAQPGELPPTNVPPPGVLLSLFPPLFEEAQNKLFKPMAAQPLPMRNKLLAESGTIAYLEGYLVLASVAARIIAGRKLRWKRDAHLSQGMRIGPASSRATSGMKLTGIDKSENMKEEREVSDVVRVWKDQVGRLRHVVAAANQIKAGTLGAIPDIQETMPVRTLKQSEGGVPAPQPCMMCGMKREERVGSADQAVEDSFGEWWIEQVMMHRGCRNFWNEHKDMLRQR
ncbi:hypothetical protein K505DRAFT_297136 [Melanomma pulvis-pyrius CBS 109.77]|uniref:Serine/threonine-protein kinase ppk6 n=1 Tax=Melanomma pulvis-pyrius CBS 109.77 TaxID=1314802 RepID=A0A6A6XNG8_9PLEO|nr:hypothetical protein K505DRAFT_297136 [Melanomma pulvis-pyrius CBS 109.77]